MCARFIVGGHLPAGAESRSGWPSQESRPVPRLRADGPNQPWSWDITYLPTNVRGVWVYPYLVVDVWIRNKLHTLAYLVVCSGLSQKHAIETQSHMVLQPLHQDKEYYPSCRFSHNLLHSSRRESSVEVSPLLVPSSRQQWPELLITQPDGTPLDL
jgi:hypothetical protein